MTTKYNIALVLLECYFYVYNFCPWISYILHSLRTMFNVPKEIMEKDLQYVLWMK